MTSEQRLIWVDMEMTGLDPDTDVVIEVASIVTTKDLEGSGGGPCDCHPPERRHARKDG